jgi:hypothetical protein
MGKQKIADSIIIRVGGGIREIPRQPVGIAESPGSVKREPGFEQTEDVHPFESKLEANTKISSDKIRS